MNRHVSLKKLGSQLAKTTLAISFITTGYYARAQDSLKTMDLNEVIISASRVAQDPLKVGRSVTVVGQDEIKNSGHSNVADLLSSTTGIFIVGTGQNPGTLQTAYLRGANADHTTILIDGVRITDPSSVDNSLNLSELSLANIERVEIVRGSHSTIYGSSAIGGVINIITTQASVDGLSGALGIGAGTFGKNTFESSESAYLIYKGKSGLYAGFEVFNQNVKGLDATADTVTASRTFKNRDKDGFEKTDVVGKLGFKNSKWNVLASLKSTKQISDADDGAFNDDDNYKIEFNRNLASYSLAFFPSSNLSANLTGGYSRMERIAVNDSSVITAAGEFDHSFSRNEFFGTILNSELQIDYLQENVSLVLGLGSYTETMSSNSFYVNTAWAYQSASDLDSLDISSTTNSAFAHANFEGALVGEHLESLNLAVGGRLNNHSTFGNDLTFEVNPSFRFSKDGVIFGSWSTGFNAPSLYRLYSPDANYLSNIRRGNLDLEPESSSSFELGLKKPFGSSTNLTISLFQTEVDNLVEYVYLWDKSIAISDLGNDWLRDDYRGDTYINLGRQINKGIEVGLEAKLGQRFSFSGNLSITDGSLKYDPTNHDYASSFHIQLFNTGDFLTESIEKHGLARRSNTANARLNYQASSKVVVSVSMKHASSRNDIFYDANLGPYGALGQKEVGEYTLFGISSHLGLTENLSANVQINNIFDQQYQEIMGYSTRGRGARVSLNYSL